MKLLRPVRASRAAVESIPKVGTDLVGVGRRRHAPIASHTESTQRVRI